MRRILLSLAAILALALSASPAAADALYTLNQGGSLGPTPGTYGTVNLHQVGSGSSAYVTVTVTLAAGSKFVGTGAGYAITWNITGNPALSSVTVTSANAANFTVQGFNPSAGGYARYKASPFTGGSCGATTASCFMYAIDYNISGSGGSDTSLVFDVKKSGGLLLSDFAASSSGYYFAADILFAGKTGNVASNGPPVYVPEPGTLMLVGAGIGGVAAYRRRRRKQAA